MTQRQVQGSGVRADSAALLRGAGLRVTASRAATLDVLAGHGHLDAESVIGAVREQLGSVSRQGVYDALRALVGAGLVRSISLDGRRALFELEQHDNHHHLVCRGCGRFEDAPCAEGSAPCLDSPAVGRHGFAIDQAEVIYRGLCPACQGRQAGSPADRAHASPAP